MARSNSATKAPVSIEWIAPPADLADMVHTFYVVDVGPGEIDEPTPAYSAQLLMIAQGSVELEYADGGKTRTGPLFLNAPQLRAGRARVVGPIKAVAASLTPLGWVSLTAHAADTVHDCAVPPDTFAAPAILHDIEAWAEIGDASRAELEKGVTYLAALLRSAPHLIRQRHREFVQAVIRWLGSELNPSLETLYHSMPLSRRQIQRLCRQFFGASPTQVLMRHRAIRTAMLLSNPDLSQSLREEVTAAYFDQAHMIRDVRRFTGRTPADFASNSLAQSGFDPVGHGETAAVLLGRRSSHLTANDSQ